MLRTVILQALMASVLIASLPAQMCTGRTISGQYGMQLSGTATISGTQAPAAVLATLTLSDNGTLSGYASVNFNGLLLGNPVTGTYELRPDCTVLLALQDDSGAFQHFRGKATPEADRIEIRQTDAGTGARGVLKKAADGCTQANMRGAYAFTLSGTATPLTTGGAPQRVSTTGNIRLGADGKLVLIKPVAAEGTIEVQSDCTVYFELPALSDAEGPVHLRGVLVNGGSEILAIQTDPGRAVAAVFTAR
jgi:hypothetical protein